MNTYTNRASCKHLTHKYPAYFGCTLSEVTIIAAIYFATDIFIAALLALFFGMFFIFFMVLFILSYLLIRVTAKKIGTLKSGKQAGYLTLKAKKWLNSKLGLTSCFIDRVGYWQRRRTNLTDIKNTRKP